MVMANPAAHNDRKRPSVDIRRSLPDRLRVGLGGLLMIVVALTSCSTPQTTDPSSAVATAATLPDDEIRVRIKLCLEEEGFVAELQADGLRIPSGDQGELVLDAYDRCVESLIDQGLVPAPAELTEEQQRDRYDALVVVAACLETLGYTISAPPSVDSFVDSGGEVWHPYLDLPIALGPAQWAEANEQCPQP